MSIAEKYPSRTPVVLLRHSSCRPELSLDKDRFLVPKDMQFMQFVAVIRKRMTLTKAEALYFYIDNKLISQTATLSELHASGCADDGLLYVTYSTENTFGGQGLEFDLMNLDRECTMCSTL